MFWFLLNESGLTKQQLRTLRDEGQKALAEKLGFKYNEKPKNE